VSLVLTARGAHYAIEGTFNDPRIRYLGGGDKGLGEWVQDHWHPTPEHPYTNQTIVDMARDYLKQGGQ
jgi:hypothetical protein